MARCQDRWVDPARGQTSSPIGPYMCGRLVGHQGVHALVGLDGSFAAWTGSGELLMAAQVAGLRQTADEVAQGLGRPSLEDLG